MLLLYELIDKYLDGKATEEERLVLETYYEQTSSGLPGLITGHSLVDLSPEKKEALKQMIYRGVRERIQTPVYRRWRFAAAAILILLVGAALLLVRLGKERRPGSEASLHHRRMQPEITPARGGAVLTLSDGSVVRLDSMDNGRLAMQGAAQIIKRDNLLSYIAPASKGGTRIETGALRLYNTVSTAKGMDIHLQLADGTEVWLDALSSIKFPVSFVGKERVVDITGQAYFQIAKDPQKPFKVRTSEQTVEVLGTDFNINAFVEPIKTTLLRGGVKIYGISSSLADRRGMVLKPGQQAQYSPGKDLKLVDGINLETTVAWKKGDFVFDGQTVEEIMDQLARWYDVDVVYRDKISETFVARISRSTSLPELLHLLEMTQQVSFQIQAKRVIVYGFKQNKNI